MQRLAGAAEENNAEVLLVIRDKAPSPRSSSIVGSSKAIARTGSMEVP